ncbi:MAG: hypothetical protein HY099_07140 [Nitrospirae bacterium]|nr:hypothetical protein [Nitrospirota bacterium]
MNWPKNRAEAKAIQDALKKRVKIIPLPEEPALVASVDAAFFRDKIIAVACLYEYPAMTPIEDAYEIGDVTFPLLPAALT